MLDDFFNFIAVPDFLKPEFLKDDWYMVLANSRMILSEQITETKLLSEGKNLSINGKVYIGANCTIGENVVIDGPVYICDGVEIGPGAYIRPGSVIGKDCSIAHAAQVKNSIMMDGSKIANHCLLADSIIGKNARIGGHCETSNRRFDQSEIQFIYKEQKLNTGLDKLGLILGESARLGGGVLSAPGTMIGKKTFIGAMTFIYGYVAPGQFVKTEATLKTVPNNFSGELKHTEIFERA